MIDVIVLSRFLAESNKIEGIGKINSDEDLNEARRFLALDEITIPDLERFVEHFQPGAKLRDKPGMDVRVGNHVPPRGGKHIKTGLKGILWKAKQKELTPFLTHKLYEAIHPITDCNGHSGRILWLWQMEIEGRMLAPMGFLETWYRQSLEEGK